MARWRYLIFDLPSMAPVGELPVISREWAELYNSPGSFTCTIDLDLDPAYGITLTNLRAPNAVWAAELDGTLIFAGPILKLAIDLVAREVTLSGEGWGNLARRRLLDFDDEFVTVDQTDIAAILLDNVQSGAYYRGDLNIDTSLAYNGPTTSRSIYYYAAESHRVGELIEDMANLTDGFYFRYEPRWTAGPNSNLTIKFLTAWPPGGRATDLVLEHGRTCTVRAVEEDGTNIANRVRVFGQGEGDERPNVLTTNPDHIEGHYVLEDDVQAQTTADLDTLRGMGHTRLRQGADMIATPEVEVDVDWLGDFLVGDQVRFKITEGLYQVDEPYRITGYKCPDEATLVLDVAPLVLFVGGNLL
jgi:hypothetical protein